MNIDILKQLITDALDGIVPELLDIVNDIRNYSPYYNLMYLLSKSYAPCICVELGVETGRGSFALACGGPTNAVVGIDNQSCKEAMELGKILHNFTYVIQSSTPPPSFLLSKKISILHIDTNHTYARVEQEWDAYKPLLAEGAVVLFDDTHAENDGVMRYIKQLPYPTIFDDRLHPNCGYAVMLYDH